jgi:hypothetical protein
MSAADRRDGRALIQRVLDGSKPRPLPTDPVGAKTKYATRFAELAADGIAAALADNMETVSASARKTAGSVRGKKQLDVNFSTPRLGLALGISLKSVHVREPTGSQRYTHNLKRNEEELRIEASGYHKRQPYAVMIGVLFLPFDSADDAKGDNPSSFGSWVRHLRPYTGRNGPDDDEDKFEKLYVALYEPDGSDLKFFDVQKAPPKRGRPARTMTFAEFLDEVYRVYLRRNEAEFNWAEGEEEPLDLEEAEFPADEEP